MNNLGTNKGMVQIKNSDPVNNTALAGHDTSPAIVDWNKDTVPDLLVGAEDGHFYYLLHPASKK